MMFHEKLSDKFKHALEIIIKKERSTSRKNNSKVYSLDHLVMLASV